MRDRGLATVARQEFRHPRASVDGREVTRAGTKGVREMGQVATSVMYLLDRGYALSKPLQGRECPSEWGFEGVLPHGTHEHTDWHVPRSHYPSKIDCARGTV